MEYGDECCEQPLIPPCLTLTNSLKTVEIYQMFKVIKRPSSPILTVTWSARVMPRTSVVLATGSVTTNGMDRDYLSGTMLLALLLANTNS